MADINVERKSRSIWPWVIGLLVLALLAWLLLSMLDNDREVVEDPVVVTEPVTTEQPVGNDPVVVTEPTTAPAP